MFPSINQNDKATHLVCRGCLAEPCKKEALEPLGKKQCEVCGRMVSATLIVRVSVQNFDRAKKQHKERSETKF